MARALLSAVRLRLPLALIVALTCAAPTQAQFGVPLTGRRAPGPPPGAPPSEAAIWPYPPPDPKSWWDEKRPKPAEAADPLGGRRIRRGERLVDPDNGVDASTYRLWGLMPLQWQLIRGDEMILEVWTRPSNSVRQTVTRIVIRGDGDAFVQGRAGLACCEAGIGRRLGFDVTLPPGSAAKFRALRDLPLWNSPRDVRVSETGAADAVCVEGSAYDLTLATPRHARTLHRACDPAEIGEVADVLQAVLGAALGNDARFDVAFPGGANFDGARTAYAELVAGGGRLRPNPDARRAPPGLEPQPQVDPTPPELGPDAQPQPVRP